MEPIFIVSAIIAPLAVVVCKTLLTFSARAHKAEIKMMRSEEEFNTSSLHHRIGWLSSDIEILTSDKFSNDEKRVIMHKYEKERKQKQWLKEQLDTFPIQSPGYGKDDATWQREAYINIQNQNRKNQNKHI